VTQFILGVDPRFSLGGKQISRRIHLRRGRGCNSYTLPLAPLQACISKPKGNYNYCDPIRRQSQKTNFLIAFYDRNYLGKINNKQ